MKKLFISITLILFSSSLLLCQNEKEETMLWRISGKGLTGTSYLFGVVNSKDSSFYKFPNKVWRYLGASDVFVTSNENMAGTKAAELYKNTLGVYERHYEVSPAAFIQQQAIADAKPIVVLKDNISMAGVIARLSRNDLKSHGNSTLTKQKLDDLKFAYGSGKLKQVTTLRKQLDVPDVLYNKLQSKQHYSMLSELIRLMQLQPTFMALDVIHLDGSAGLISLLRARGFDVKPLEAKFYDKREKTLTAQRNYFGGNPVQNVGENAPVYSQSTPEPLTSVTPRINFTRDMPFLLSTDWQPVYTTDSLYSAAFPGIASKLENADGSAQFSLNQGGLSFQLSISPMVQMVTADVNTRLVLQTGGQVSQSNKAVYGGIAGTHTELIYGDNKLSEHFVASLGGKQIEASVSGKPPHIFSAAVQQFFNSIMVNAAALPINVLTANSNGVPAVVETWPTFRAKNLYGILPVAAATNKEKTANNIEVTTHQIFSLNDGNKYIIAVNERSTFDNFMLFNTSINAAAAEAKAIIVERSVMENGRTNYAKYQLKDALDNYYHIEYWYDGNHFYQFVVKGNKKSVGNATVNKISNSLVLMVAN